MTKHPLRSLLLGLLALTLAPATVTHVRADGPVEIRMATIAPKASKAMRILRAWDMSVQEKTQGRVKFRFYAGGIAGDERDVLRKMKVNQLDSTTLTSVGSAARALGFGPADAGPVQELQGARRGPQRDGLRVAKGVRPVGLPPARLVRHRLRPHLLGAAHRAAGRPQEGAPVGLARRPGLPRADEDRRRQRRAALPARGVPRAPDQDGRHGDRLAHRCARPPVVQQREVHDQAGRHRPGRRHARVQHHVQEPQAGGPGGAGRDRRQAHQKALELISSEEQADYAALKARGIVEVDTAPHAAAWEKSYAELRAHLTGKLFSKEQLDRVMAAAASARK